MKVLLLNDTSKYHNGCKEVIANLKKYYNPAVLCKTFDEIDTNIIDHFDLVVLNGEGTLHHNSTTAIKFLSYLKLAQEKDKQTHLVNTVWQQMSESWKKTVERCNIIDVREILSHREIGYSCNIVLDASMHSDVLFTKKEKSQVCLGGSFNNKLTIEWDNYKSVSIFKTSWEDLVNILRSTDLLITGRHHEMYASLKAGTRVITVPGNTWKNEGFFHTVGVPELIMHPTKENIKKTLDGYYDSYWEIVWSYLKNAKFKYK